MDGAEGGPSGLKRARAGGGGKAKACAKCEELQADARSRAKQAARGSSSNQLPPEAVLTKLVHAIENPNPRPRYFVTFPTYLIAILQRILPTRALDWFLARA